MAPKGKDSLLDLSTTCIQLGNSVAVHMLDYLSVVKDPPHGFNKLAVEFLELARTIIPAKSGLQGLNRSYSSLSTDTTNYLKERFRQVHTSFVVLGQVVDKFNEGEKKQGFGKLGKSFRMMFADSEIEKLRLSLVQCRENLEKNKELMSWALGENQIEPAAGIGYTALAAVMGKADPTRGRAGIEHQQAPAPAPTSPLQELPMVPSSPMMDTFSRSLSTGPELPSPSSPSQSMLDRERLTPPSYSRESSKFSSSSNGHSSYSRGSSNMAFSNDAMSDVTTSTSVGDMNEMLMSQDLNDRSTKPAVRVQVDPSKVPRWNPSAARPGAASPQSRHALLVAVQQSQQKAVEQLLDSGVPPDGTPERNLLTVAIVNHDFTTVRLLLLFGADPNNTDASGNSPLFSAIQASFFDAVQILLKYGADPDKSAGPYDESPFARALNSGQTPLVDLLLKHNAQPDKIMGSGNTAFIQAINKTVPLALMKLMIDYGSDCNHKNQRGETALFKAVGAERVDIVELLIDNGAKPDLPGPKHMLWPAVHQPVVLELLLSKGANIRKAPGVLELATSTNSLEAVNILLKYRASPNDKKDGIFTPLCSAIRDNREELVDIMLSHDADPNLPSAEYPAFKCVTHSRPQFLPKVIAAGAKLDKPAGIVECAVSHKEKKCLTILLEHGADVNARNPETGQTALQTAIKTRQMDILDILLEHGGDPGVRGTEWPIALAVKDPKILAKLLPHIQAHKIVKGAIEQAVVADQLESVKLLVAKGVNIEEKTAGVFSPLTTSIREDRKEIFRYLVDEAHASVNEPGEHLPIIKAIRRHREDDLSYIEHLIGNGADINLVYRGYNAVLQAVDNGDTKILKLLASKGSPDLTATDENGQTVMEIMEDRGLVEEERILLGGRSPSPRMRQAMSSLRWAVQEE